MVFCLQNYVYLQTLDDTFLAKAYTNTFFFW